MSTPETTTAIRDTSSLTEAVPASEGVDVRIRAAVLNRANSAQLQDELSEHVSKAKLARIDLTAVKYVDHFAFDALLSAVRQCPGQVRYRKASNAIRSLFILAHLDSLLENHQAV